MTHSSFSYYVLLLLVLSTIDSVASRRIIEIYHRTCVLFPQGFTFQQVKVRISCCCFPQFIQQTIVEQLTPDDVRILVESLDEDSRRGNMQRVFPNTATSHKYLRFFEQPRYYNLLLDTWLQRYNRMEARGE